MVLAVVLVGGGLLLGVEGEDGGDRAACGGGGQCHALDDPVIVCAQALEDGDQAPVAGGRHHVAGVLPGLQEDRHQDAGYLALAGFLAQRPPDDLHDLHRAGAGVGEDDRADPARAPDIDPFTEDAAGGEEGQLAYPSVGVQAVGVAGEDVAAVGGGVFAGEPVGADAGGVGGGVGVVEAGGGLRHRPGKAHRVQSARVEGHVRAHAGLIRVLEESGLEGCEPAAPPLLQGGVFLDGCWVADLQHDLEAGEDSALDTFHQAGFVEDGPVQVQVVHRGNDPPAQRPAALCSRGRAGAVALGLGLVRCAGSGCPQAWGGGHVEAPGGGEAGLIVDARPRLRGVARCAVCLIDHQEVEGRHFLPVRAAQCLLQDTEGLVVGVVVVLVVGQALPGQRGVGGEDQHRARACPEGELCGVGGAPHPEGFQQRVGAEGADGDGGAGVSGPAPHLDRLRQQVQGGDQHADHPARAQPERGNGRCDGLAGSGGHVDLPAQPAHGQCPVGREGQARHDPVDGLDLVRPEGDPGPVRLRCLLHTPMLLATRCPNPVRLLHNLASNLGQ